MTFIIGYLVTTTISKSIIEFVKRDIEKRLIKNNYQHSLNCERKLQLDAIFKDQYTYFPLFNITIALDAIVEMDNMYKSIVATDVKKEVIVQEEAKIEIPEDFDHSIESDLELLKKFREEVSIINNNYETRELDLNYFRN